QLRGDAPPVGPRLPHPRPPGGRAGLPRPTGRRAVTAAARARVAAALVVAVGVVAAVAAVRLARSDGDGVVADPVPDDTLSAPGTALPDGFAVAEGSSLVGPVVVEEVDGRGEPTSWWALLLVE